MKTRLLSALTVAALALVGALFLSSASAEDAEPAGKQAFLAQKCNMCHSVSSAGIEATTKSEKMKGPDLTGQLEGKDRAALLQYLKKETDKDGKKHSKAIAGTDEEIQAMLDWLAAQKAPA